MLNFVFPERKLLSDYRGIIDDSMVTGYLGLELSRRFDRLASSTSSFRTFPVYGNLLDVG